jgi:hypothetical protein
MPGPHRLTRHRLALSFLVNVFDDVAKVVEWDEEGGEGEGERECSGSENENQVARLRALLV